MYVGEEYEAKLLEKKYSVLLGIKVDDKEIPEQVVKDLHFLLNETRKIELYEKKLKRTNKDIEDRVSREIREEHPIKSQSFTWFTE